MFQKLYAALFSTTRSGESAARAELDGLAGDFATLTGSIAAGRAKVQQANNEVRAYFGLDDAPTVEANGNGKHRRLTAKGG